MRIVFLLIAFLSLASPTLAQQPDNEIRREVSGRAAILLGHRDYKDLNELADQYRASGEKTPGGTSKLSLFYAGLVALPLNPYATDDEWQAAFKFAEEWIGKRPSPAAYIYRAEMNIRYAWQQRGADGSTSREREKSFQSHIRTAHQQLIDCKAFAGSDLEWAAAMERVQQAEKATGSLPVLRAAAASTPLTIPHVDYSPTDEFNVRANIQLQARLLFEGKKFQELNALASHLVNGERTPAGMVKLQYFYEGLLNYADYQTPSLGNAPNEKQWQTMFNRVQDWIAKSPSPAAYVTLAKLHHRFAWAWRGDGMANSVRFEAWKPYREQLKVEHDILMAHKADAASDPEWYFTMENLALEQGWGESESRSLYDEALVRHRYYDRIYFAIATRLEPKWGGSWEAVEQLANASAHATKDKMGDILYTRIYQWTIDCGCRMFAESGVNWSRMKAGFQEMLKRFPDPWNANQFAYFACQAEDKATTKALLAKLPLVIIPAWDGDSDTYQHCKAWAAAA